MGNPERKQPMELTPFRKSREILENFITGEQEKYTSLKDIRNLIIERNLWFGFDTDYVDYLFMLEARGIVEIYIEEGEVRSKANK